MKPYLPRTLLAYNRSLYSLRRKAWFIDLSSQQKFTYIEWLLDTANRRVEYLEELIVPKKGKKSNANMFSTQFAAITLDATGKSRFQDWFTNHSADVETYLHNLATEGWKTSFSFDHENDCFLASCTMRDEEHKNYDICVTSRSGNLVEALMLCVFKIEVLFEGQKLPTEAPRMSWG